MDLENGNYFKACQFWLWWGITIRITDNQVLDVESHPRPATHSQRARFSGWSRSQSWKWVLLIAQTAVARDMPPFSDASCTEVFWIHSQLGSLWFGRETLSLIGARAQGCTNMCGISAETFQTWSVPQREGRSCCWSRRGATENTRVTGQCRLATTSAGMVSAPRDVP